MNYQVEIVPHPEGGYTLRLAGDPAGPTTGRYATRERALEIAAMHFYEVVDATASPPGNADLPIGLFLAVTVIAALAATAYVILLVR